MRQIERMPELNISKVAVACGSLDALRERQRQRQAGGVVPLVTRFMPKRADELVGGSLYWSIKHRIVARQTLLGFAAREEDKRTVISLDPDLVPTRAWPKRAHQGWRYLAASDAPQDLAGGEDGIGELPPPLAAALAAVALI
jgi:hypothetical protein